MKNRFTRRAFLGTGGAALAGGLGSTSSAQGRIPDAVNFWVDGILPSPLEFVSSLHSLAEADPKIKDRFGRGGAVERLESEMARRLGKERGLYLPTGTMANQLALRVLSRGRPVVYAQESSHVFRDEADAAQIVHGRRVVPWTWGAEDLESSVARVAGEGIRGGALTLEVPLRRRENEVAPLSELRGASAYARSLGMGVHLDGARLLLASEYTGVTPSQYAALFDTVYISLYKYLRAPAGAILCGPAAVLEDVARLRRVHGGDLYQHWPYASVALHFLEGFPERFARARAQADDLFRGLEASGRFRLHRSPNGANIVRLEVLGVNASIFRDRARERDLKLNRPLDDGLVRVHVNETQLGTNVSALAAAFLEAHEAAGSSGA